MTPHREIPEDTELTFLPYWRFKGVQYACTPSGVDHWFTDVSCLAIDDAPDRIPYSLGFRSQALKLKRVSARTRGTFIRPRSLKESLTSLSGRTRSSGRALIKEDIGEAVSLIYAPFYHLNGKLFDGILNTPLGKSEGMDKFTQKDHCRPEKETRILSGVCPGCGWDLEGQSDSLALICRNCDSLWQPQKDKLARIRFGASQPQDAKEVLIPFWKVSAQVSGMALSTRQDLMQMANLPGGEAHQNSGAEPNTLSFWAPAFKIRPKVFLRISRQVTLAQPLPELKKEITKNTHLPVTLPATEAIQSIRITLASLARPLRDHLPLLGKAKIKANAASLIFLPFEPHHHEFIHRQMNLAINTNVLKLSGNL